MYSEPVIVIGGVFGSVIAHHQARDSCNIMCGQKSDLLCAAGLPQDDKRVADLCDVSRVCPAAHEHFLEFVKLPVSSSGLASCASQELLHDVVNRAKWLHSPSTEASHIKKLNFDIASSFLSATDSLAGVKLSSLNLHSGKCVLQQCASLCRCCTKSARPASH